MAKAVKKTKPVISLASKACFDGLHPLITEAIQAKFDSLIYVDTPSNTEVRNAIEQAVLAYRSEVVDELAALGVTAEDAAGPQPKVKKAKKPAKQKQLKVRSFLHEIKQRGGIKPSSFKYFTDPKETNGPMFSLIKKKSGFGMDQMAGMMADDGWIIPHDVDGNVDVNGFAAILVDAVNGNPPTHPDNAYDLSDRQFEQLENEYAGYDEREMLDESSDDLSEIVEKVDAEGLAFADDFFSQFELADEVTTDEKEADQDAGNGVERVDTGREADNLQGASSQEGTGAQGRFEKTATGEEQGVLTTGKRDFKHGKDKTGGKRVSTSDLMDGFTDAGTVQPDMFGQEAAKYSLSPAPPANGGVAIKKLSSAVATMQQMFPGVKIAIHDSPADVSWATPTARGAYYKGEVHLFRSNIKDSSQAALTVLAHEFTHHGLDNLGAKGKQLLDQIALAHASEVKKIMVIRGWKDTPENRVRAANELVAQHGETKLKPNWWNKVREFMQSVISQITGKPVKLSLIDEAIREIRGQAAPQYGAGFMLDPAFMTAWHGSPHDHDKFSTDKIGTGEGAQAYGYGLYFAGNKEVAEWYKNGLSSFKSTYNGATLPANIFDISHPLVVAAKQLIGDNKRILHLVNDAIMDIGVLSDKDIESMIADNSAGYYQYDEGRIAKLFKEMGVESKKSGRLYKVELAPEEDQYLLWDKPLSEQSDKVREAIGQVKTLKGNNLSDITYDKDNGGWIYNTIAGFKGSDRAASEYLHSLGIRGIKYLDGNSRSGKNEDYNYVIFSDEDITIEEKYSMKQSEESEQQQYEKALTSSISDAKAELKRLGLDNEAVIKFVDSIANGKAEGSQLGDIIKIAMDAKDPIGVLHHEVIHLLREKGILTDNEFKALNMASKQWLKNHPKRAEFEARYKEYAKNFSAEQIDEERVADMFRGYGMAQRENKSSFVSRIITRIRQFFRAMGNAFKGNSFVDAEAVMQAIYAGKKNKAQGAGFGRLAEATSSRATSAPFYSAVERMIADAKQNAWGSAKDLVNWLTGKVTTDEIKQLGLDTLEGKLTKQQVLDEIAANSVEFKDVVLGNQDDSPVSHAEVLEVLRDNDALGYDSVTEALTVFRVDGVSSLDNYEWNSPADKALVKEYLEFTGGVAHFSQYTEPGAVDGSYREMFVTAPGVGSNLKPMKNYSIKNMGGYWLVIQPDGNASGIFDNEQDAIKSMESRNRLNKERQVEDARWYDGHSQYDKIQNPVVRIRFNDREVDGKRILFVEEMQPPTKSQISKMPEYLRNRAYAIGVKRILAYAKENGYDGVAWTSDQQQLNRWGTERIDWKVRNPVTQAEDGLWNAGRGTKYGTYDTKQEAVEAAIKNGFTVSMKEQEGGNADGVNIEETARQRGQLLEENGTTITSKDELLALIKRNLREGTAESIADKVWKQMQDNPEGTYRPRHEFMKSIYGTEKGPQNLGTLFAKYGKEKVGKMDIASLGSDTQKYYVDTASDDNGMWIIRDEDDNIVGREPTMSIAEEMAQRMSDRSDTGLGGRTPVPYIPITDATQYEYAKFSLSPPPDNGDTEQPVQHTAKELLSRAAKAVNNARHNIFDTASVIGNEFMGSRYRTKGLIERAYEDAKALHDRIAKFRDDPDTTNQISEFLTTKEAGPAMIKNEEARMLAQQAKRLIMQMGRSLVARKLMKEDTLEKREGEYLPRLYVKHLLGQDLFNSMLTAGGKTLDLSYLKQRRDDIPEEVRRLILGEIKDPAYLVYMALARPARDLALHAWMREIASVREWTMPKMLVDWNISDNPTYRIGNITYKIGDDGLYTITKQTNTRVWEDHDGVDQAFIAKNIGAAFARHIKQTAKEGEWVSYGSAKWKKAGEGLYDIKIQRRQVTEELHDGIHASELDALVGERRAEWMRTGMITSQRSTRPVQTVGGMQVTPFWLASEAKRLRSMIDDHGVLPEESRRHADRMEDLARKALHDAGYQFDENMELKAASLPDGWKQIPNTAKYGPLRGLVVRAPIYSDIVGNLGGKGKRHTGSKWDNFAEEFLGDNGVLWTANRIWKATKTTYNPGTHAANGVSNAVLVHLNTQIGIHEFPEFMKKAFEALSDPKNKYYRIGKLYGFTAASFSNMEIGRINTELLDYLRHAEGKTHPLKQVQYILGKISNKAGDVYQLNEQLFKNMVLIYNMEKQGMSEEQAALEAHWALFDYSDVSAVVRFLREHYLGSPFLTFSYKITAQMVRNFAKDIRASKKALTSPGTWADKGFALYTATNFTRKLATWNTILYMLPGMVASSLGIGDDDWDKIKKSAMGFVRAKSHGLLLPMMEDGELTILDVSRMAPWDTVAQIGKSALGAVGLVDDYQPMSRSLGLLGGPVPQLISVLKTGRDPFTQRELWPASDGLTGAEKAGRALMYLYNMSVPSFMSQYGSIKKGYDWATGHVSPKTGKPTTWGEAVAPMLGAGITNYKPELTRQQQLKWMAYELQGIKNKKSDALRDANVKKHPELENEIRREWDTRIQRKMLEISKFKAATRFNPDVLK